jgi:uncharacterized protein (DUF1684 family)
MLNRRVATAALALTLAACAACTSGPGPIDEGPHREAVLAWRTEKDVYFKSHPDSPLLPEDRGRFTNLVYYDIDADFRVPSFLTVDRSGPPVVIEMQTSTNQRRRMQKVGTLGFSLGMNSYTLTAFADEGTQSVDRLFIPFGDLTNRQETYGGGRYIELQRTPTGLYDLDFTRAYNPFCVYNASFDCPLPPRENRLEVAIPAGERMGGLWKG